jgi:hypothetical protein
MMYINASLVYLVYAQSNSGALLKLPYGFKRVLLINKALAESLSMYVDIDYWRVLYDYIKYEYCSKVAQQ